MQIEAEIKSFISKEKFEELLRFFKKNAEYVKEDYQETYYFDSKNAKRDLRIQKNDYFSKIILKTGDYHDECREELEVQCDKNDFEKIEKLFLDLGYQIEIKWFRKRFDFRWNDINVELGNTKAYGYIIELEKICPEEEKEEIISMLKSKLKELNVDLTSKEEFTEKFSYYRKNWQELTKVNNVDNQF
ncbi:MAG: hypothetical protein ACOYT4_02055 [Nanoarchaeota archaeon]